jgi:hypothetical protein
MFRSSQGELLVYASTFADHTRRLKPVSSAAERMARALNINFRLVTFSKKFTPIYVYYKNGDEEPVPLYCTHEEESDVQEVCKILRNMLFVLSFHPKYPALRNARKELMRFS